MTATGARPHLRKQISRFGGRPRHVPASRQDGDLTIYETAGCFSRLPDSSSRWNPWANSRIWDSAKDSAPKRSLPGQHTAAGPDEPETTTPRTGDHPPRL